MQRPDRGTCIETLAAQWAIPFFTGGTVEQQITSCLYDLQYVGPPAPVADIAGLPLRRAPLEHQEIKSACCFYVYNDPGASVRTKLTNPGYYLYVRVQFYFSNQQMAAILTPVQLPRIHAVILCFVQRNPLDLGVTMVRCTAEQLCSNHCTKGAAPSFNHSIGFLQLHGTRLVNDVTRTHADGTILPPFWPTSNGRPPDVSEVPVSPADFARLISRCTNVNDATAYPGPPGQGIGRIVG